ncbi:MAG: EamA family transporter [Desulfobacterales bacterium]|nr:EamA family transporter [Desulfobacterales bacterium]
MLGSLFALLSAMSFALNAIFLRRAVIIVVDISVGILISVSMAVPLLFLVIAFTGQIHTLLNFTWQGYVWLSLAGIVHFVFGRTLNYKCIQLVGANIANILSRSDILISVVIGVTVLREPLGWGLGIGVFLILTGITLTGLNSQRTQKSSESLYRIPARAFVLGLGAGVSWGVAPIFVKLGLDGIGSPVAGAFVSFVAATAILSLSLLKQKTRISISATSGRAAGFFFAAGFLSFVANFVRYIALDLAPASVVTPLASTVPVFVLIFSFAFNRKLEIFNPRVVIGAISVVIGTLFLV